MKSVTLFLALIATFLFNNSYCQTDFEIIEKILSKEPERDSFEQFYQCREIEIDRIDRLHKPLDPLNACMIPYRNGKKFGFKSLDGSRVLIEPKFDQVYQVTSIGAIVSNKDLYGLVDTTGDFIIPPRYTNMFQERGNYCGILSEVWSEADSVLPK